MCPNLRTKKLYLSAVSLRWLSKFKYTTDKMYVKDSSHVGKSACVWERSPFIASDPKQVVVHTPNNIILERDES